MLVALVSVVHFLVTLNALLRSAKSRFWVGAMAGLARAGLTITAIAVGLRLAFSGGEGTPAGPARVALAVGILGPIVSVGTLVLAHLRKRGVAASEEERFDKPFMAWLPVALLDIGFVVIALLARAISDPF